MARARSQPAPEPPAEDEGTGLDVAAAPGGMAPLTVKVSEGSSVKDESGVLHEAGEEFPIEGLTAVALAQSGHVTITGTHDGELPDADAARTAALEVEREALEARLKEIDELL